MKIEISENVCCRIHLRIIERSDYRPTTGSYTALFCRRNSSIEC